jgi:3-oxoacyl-[acyl-carrier protein] reductase
MELYGKKALIRGAGKGIGHAIAKALAKEGVQLGLVARSAPNLEQLAAELRANYKVNVSIATASASHYEEVEQAVRSITEEIGPLDMVISVNNPGLGKTGPFAQTVPYDWTRNIEVNLLGMYYVNRAVISGMLERGSGTILNVFSAAGSFGMLHDSANTAAKFAAIGITESLRQEVSGHPIHVHALTPDTLNREAARERGLTVDDTDWMSQIENVAELAVAVIRKPESGLLISY